MACLVVGKLAFICALACACTPINKHANVCARVRTCKWVSVRVHMPVCMCARARAHVRTHTRTHPWTHARTHALHGSPHARMQCMEDRTHLRTHARTRARTHARTHTRMHARPHARAQTLEFRRSLAAQRIGRLLPVQKRADTCTGMPANICVYRCKCMCSLQPDWCALDTCVRACVRACTHVCMHACGWAGGRAGEVGRHVGRRPRAGGWAGRCDPAASCCLTRYSDSNFSFST